MKIKQLSWPKTNISKKDAIVIKQNIPALIGISDKKISANT